MTIKELVASAIAEGQPLRMETRDGAAGVWLDDRQMFIAWDELGYSSELGFFSIIDFPFMDNEAG